MEGSQTGHEAFEMKGTKGLPYVQPFDTGGCEPLYSLYTYLEQYNYQQTMPNTYAKSILIDIKINLTIAE